MRKTRFFRRFFLFALCAAMLLCTSACGFLRLPVAPNPFLLGHWVDINSDATLEVSSTRLTIDFQTYKESYAYRVARENGETVLKIRSRNAMISELTLTDKGSLYAYEIILDGDGRVFQFVREEDLDRFLKIVDLSDGSAPKVIGSDEIESFDLQFTNYGGSYGLDADWESGYYTWSIERSNKGCEMDFHVFSSSYVALDFSGSVSEDYVKGLAQLLTEKGVVSENGYYMRNEVNRAGYSLYVRYASGETLSIRAEGDAAADCVFDLPALLDYASEQDLRSGDWWYDDPAQEGIEDASADGEYRRL